MQSILQQLVAMMEAAAAGDPNDGLEPEVDAAARRIKRLLRAKLDELRAVPLRGAASGHARRSESSSGARPRVSLQGPADPELVSPINVCSEIAVARPFLVVITQLV